jgi:hypothetical protein
MRFYEVIENPDRPEFMEIFLKYFKIYQPIKKIRDAILIKSVSNEHTSYGIIRNDDLISVLILSKYNEKYYQVLQTATHIKNQNQGWLTALFDYAIGDAHISILSDLHQTTAAKKAWISFKRNRRFEVYVYNIDTEEIFDTVLKNNEIFTKDDINPYSDEISEKYLLLATPKDSNILSEQFALMTDERNKRGAWRIEWYGADLINNDGFYNP